MPPTSDPASRDRLRSLLGMDRFVPSVPAALAPTVGALSSATAPPQLTRILTADGRGIPAYLLRADPAVATGAGVVLIAGHGRGIDDLVRTDPADGYHGALAHRLVAAGLTVLCPEMESFGRRRSPAAPASRPYAPGDSSCRIDAPRHLLTGTTLLGRRVADAAAAADALRRLPDVDPARVAIAGGSGGGAVALLLAALDEEISAALVATYFCTFEASVLALPHCPCTIVPGLLDPADGPALEMADIGRLIAPRPLILEAGRKDPIFPISATRAEFARLLSAWHEPGGPGPRLVVTDEGHRFVAADSLRLFAAALAPSA
ncbi:acetylxylan esterase [Brachybacterium hainanense]|uniref:Acetylxylan esterase n=1 Tax=Brachybacterium hainanense TaxID=1541174 RepID=A0ABV6R6G0_9MICO